MQLLLPSAHSAVLVEPPKASHHMRNALLVLGLLIVLFGALDLLSRIPLPQLSSSDLRAAFAPAATLP